MSQTQDKELKCNEEIDPLADEEAEVPEDEVHDKDEGNDRQPEEIGW